MKLLGARGGGGLVADKLSAGGGSLGDLVARGGGGASAGSSLAPKKSKGPKARISLIKVVEIDGPREKKQVARLIRRHAPKLKRCYQKALKSNAELAGAMEMTLRISAKGKVKAIAIKSDGVGDAKLGKCMKAMLKRARFPKAKGGTTTVRIKLVLKT